MKASTLVTALLVSGFTAAGQEYWQQRVDTRIEVTLDDQQHYLRGFEELNYQNNSPDTLRHLYVHLWPNAYQHDHTQYAEQQYRNGNTDFYYAREQERGFIDSLDFTIDGRQVLYFSTEYTPDIARIDLPAPLPPGGSMTITTPFRVKLPKVFSRLGHTGQAYFISQWFPKPAVYDKKGWHPIPYLDLGEFYSEFGSYDVSITLPSNYVVMATGNLMNEDEQRWLDELAALSDDSIRARKKQAKPESSSTLKTVRFVEGNVHDFAWFADKRWVVRKDSVKEATTGEQITTWSAFLPGYLDTWRNANRHLIKAVEYYGKWVGPYPYKTIKAVQGDMKAGGGMEYPTITVIDRDMGEEYVIIHEAGHNWFYGILGSNERDHAWLDEGINTFYEQKTIDAIRKEPGTRSLVRDSEMDISMNAILYQMMASGKDQPIDQTSLKFRELNYGLDVYYKTAMLLRWLEDYMGEERFEAAMKAFYQTWKFKHPDPEDFRAVFQQHTDRPIDWFFDAALQHDQMFDFRISGVEHTEEGLVVTVQNKTQHELPVGIAAYTGDSVLVQVWSMPFRGSTRVTLPSEALSWEKVVVSKSIPDGRTPNNEFRRRGLIRRSGLRIRPFAGDNLTAKQKLFLLPVAGFNTYDGFQAGLAFHNLTWPETKFKFAVAPLYAFRSKTLNGAASLGYHLHPRRGLKELLFQLDMKSFHYDETEVNIEDPLFARYIKLAPSVEAVFREQNPHSKVRRSLLLKGFAIREEGFEFHQDPQDSLYKPTIGETDNFYGLLRYTHRNDRTFNPFSYGVEAQLGEYFAKFSLEGKLKINYHARNKALHLRAYAGKFLSLKNETFVTDRYYLNTTFTGQNDYLYEDTYIGRSEREGFSSRQVSLREGGFKIPTPLYASPLGRSDDWLAAVNIKTDLPLKRLPVRLYLDVATFAKADKLNPSGNKILYNGGVEVYFLDIIQVYVPLVMSKDFRDYQTSISGKDGILDGITFSLALHKINWLRTPSGILKLLGN